MYPARMHKSAGFMRAWGSHGKRNLGEQTTSNITFVGRGSERAHAMAGVLVPFKDKSLLPRPLAKQFTPVPWEEFDWLSWPNKPAGVTTVAVMSMDLENFKPATFDMPILQTHIDLIVSGALRHGKEFAAEWLDTIQWWTADDGVAFYLNDREQARRPWAKNPRAREIDDLLAEHPPCNVLSQRSHLSSYGLVAMRSSKDSPLGSRLASAAQLLRKGAEGPPPPPLATRRKVTNFLIGFGSIIQTASRAGSDPGAVDAAPCRIKASWGYVREWNFQASTAQICALGLRRVRPGEVGATINGVLFPAADDLTAFDARENGYQRVEVALDQVELLSWHTLPSDANIFVYVPYAPSVVAKYGVDPSTGLTRCSGAAPPDGLRADEAAGLGLVGPSVKYPILQTYVDVCITGCLEYGEAFAREFIATTFLWSAYWLNERELARRPWLHQKQYVKIDALLKEGVPEHFRHRKLESEYATYFTDEH